MRKQFLGATAALLGAGALVLGIAPAPTEAAAWKPLNPLPFPAGNPTEVEVVSTGPGDAVAAAVIGGAVHAYAAVDGVWVGHDQVRPNVGASGLTLAANSAGDAVVAWREDVDGDVRVRASRRVSTTNWDGEALLTPVGSDVTGRIDLGIAGNGLVIATATVDSPHVDNQLLVTEWAQGASPSQPEVLAFSESFNPSLDVNESGEALIAAVYDGLVDEIVEVYRRTPGQGWNLGDSTSNSGNTASAPEVAISANGHGQVIYAVVKNNVYVAETSLVLPDGTAQPAQVVSPLDEFVSEPSVDMNSSGSATFAWIAFKGGTYSVRTASAADKAFPGASAKLSGTLAQPVDVTAAIGDSGLKVVQHTGGGQIATHYKTGGIQPYVPVYTGTGFAADHDVSVDDEGNAVMVGFKPGGAVYGRFLDAAGPQVAVDPIPVNTTSLDVPVSWTAEDSVSDVGTSDLYSSAAAWNQAAFADPAIAAHDVAGTEEVFAGLPGRTYCFQVHTGDTAGNARTSNERCTTIPLDDRSLLGDGWNRANGTGHFRNTVTATKTNGRVLTRTGVKAKRLALVVEKFENGGKVRVTFAGQVLGDFSLVGTGKRKVIPLTTFPSVTSGTLTIKVVSATGKQVNIDGLVVAK